MSGKGRKRKRSSAGLGTVPGKRKLQARTRAARQARAGLHLRIVGVRKGQDWSPRYPAAKVTEWAARCKALDRANWTPGTTAWMWDKLPPAPTLWARVKAYQPRIPVQLVVLHAHGDKQGMLHVGTTPVPLLDVLKVVYAWEPQRVVVLGCHMSKVTRKAGAIAALASINTRHVPTFVGHGTLWVPDWGWHEGWELEQRCWHTDQPTKSYPDWCRRQCEVSQLT